MSYRQLFMALFFAIPFIEYFLFFEVAARIGFGAAILLLSLASLSGFILLRNIGIGTVSRLQSTLRSGRPPFELLGELSINALAALLLFIPGFLSDLAALLLIIPWTRELLFSRLKAPFTSGVNQTQDPASKVIEGEFSREDSSQ